MGLKYRDGQKKKVTVEVVIQDIDYGDDECPYFLMCEELGLSGWVSEATVDTAFLTKEEKAIALRHKINTLQQDLKKLEES